MSEHNQKMWEVGVGRAAEISGEKWGQLQLNNNKGNF